MAASRPTPPRPGKPKAKDFAPPPEPVIAPPKPAPGEPLTPNSPHPRAPVNIRADKVREK
ncbi:MAG: hypothetical protein JSS11_00150 [Verrucomicrobia bacterium]|nr:hypothetical protein [Verrucomicrobiota bacterium]